VVFTALARHSDLLSPGASALVRLDPQASQDSQVPFELHVVKNRLGPVGTVSLTAVFGALEFNQGDDAGSRPL
jgi:hypothetical protein